jgi:hypothetical protein
MNNDGIVKIVLNYKDESFTIEIQKYKKLRNIKEKAYKLFYPLKTDIDIKYNNKSLSSLLDQSIGMIFNEKSFLRLIIVPRQGVSKQKEIKLNKKAILSPLDFSYNNKSIEKENQKMTVSSSRNYKKENIKSLKDENNKNKNMYIKSVEKIKKTKTEIENNIIHNNNKTNNNKGDKFNYYENLNLKVNGKKNYHQLKKIKKMIIIN